MVKLKFQRRVACLSEEKFKDASIDSSATHKFFHKLSSFITYERVNEEPVKAESSTYRIFGKRMFKLPIDGGITIEAYHAPEFSANIISVRLLLSTYAVEFAETCEAKAFCCIKRRTDLSLVA